LVPHCCANQPCGDSEKEGEKNDRARPHNFLPNEDKAVQASRILAKHAHQADSIRQKKFNGNLAIFSGRLD
jgi:hypothetical protein